MKYLLQLHRISIGYMVASIWLIAGISASKAQSIPDNHLITVRLNDTLVKAHILNLPLALKRPRNTSYHYYARGKILQAQQGYTGLLLHGSYESFYPGQVLKSQGVFYRGLKTGIWRHWHPNGRVAREENWKKGSLNGHFREYYPTGAFKVKGRYRKGQLRGRLLSYTSDGFRTVQHPARQQIKWCLKWPFSSKSKRKAAE